MIELFLSIQRSKGNMKKTVIVYGKLENALQKRALCELTEILLDYSLDYPICVSYDKMTPEKDTRYIYLGTSASNPYVKAHTKSLTLPESYSVSVKDDTVIIEGADDAGVLYGVLDFYNKYVVKFEHPETDEYVTNIFSKDTLPDFEISEAPSVRERGLWSWGHVIYDYRGYFDNMLKLKMNSVIIWNDFVPANARDIVEYAHACNIKIYWGFSWLWDVDCLKCDLSKLDGKSEKILKKYEAEYRDTGADGIYFQTFTETKQDNIKGILIADAASRFVNKTAEMFFEKYPDITLQFGLHASSVKNRLEFIERVDPRIHIIWEDCGAFPFSYVPTDLEDFDGTMELVHRASHLRGEGERFGVVTKGLVKLDWTSFEHLRGSQCIGVSSRAVKENRIARKKRIWRYIQAAWLANADRVLEAVRGMCRAKNGDLPVFALVEDGMFEENIMYPVALYSEMLWNADGDVKEMTKNVAMRSYVTFA